MIRPIEGGISDAMIAEHEVITAANLGLSLAVLITMVLAVRNLPALIEIVLIQRFNMATGERYAVRLAPVHAAQVEAELSDDGRAVYRRAFGSADLVRTLEALADPRTPHRLVGLEVRLPPGPGNVCAFNRAHGRRVLAVAARHPRLRYLRVVGGDDAWSQTANYVSRWW